MSRHIRSPLEHGELEASPYHSPDIEIGVAGDSHISDDDSNEDTTPRHDDEEELGPEIKPPQAKVKKDKHKHKHKHDKRKTSDRDRDRHGDRSEKGSKHSGRSMNTDSGRSSKEQKDRPRMDRRQDTGPIDRDRRARQARLKEEEFRREKSQKERERLEKLEMERRRLDREISRREAEQRDKLQRERERDRQERIERNRKMAAEDDKRRVATRQNLEKRRDNYRDTKYHLPRSRSPQTRRDPDNYSQERRQKPDRNEEPSYSRSSQQSRVEEPPTPMDISTNQRRKHNEVEDEEVNAVSSEDSDSDSDASSSGDSDSGSDSSSEEDEDAEKVKSKAVAKHADRVKSRFDSESAEEGLPVVPLTDSDHDSEHLSDQAADNHDYNDYLDETPPQSPIELMPDLPPYYPAIQGCRNVEEFNCLFRIEEGTYGVVYKARDKKTDENVALKRLKMEKEKDGFPITSLREINTLLKAQHPNIVTVREIVVGSNMDRIYIVMDYVEHDLKGLMERMKEPFMVGEVKTLMIQLLRGVAHLHDNWIIHRDLKTSNLLLSNNGILKIGDFGLAREYGSPLKQYTPIVVTLWYRSPELLLGTKEYACAIDMWSVGCIMAEFLTRKPLFPGKSEMDELNRIFKELGTPNEKIWPGVSDLKCWKTCTFADYPYNQLRNRFGGIITDKGFELMNRFLTYNPSRRITAEEGLKHEWFKESPSPVDPSMFPTWPAKNEQSHHRGKSPKPPSGGKAYSSLLNDDDEKLGFHLPGVATSGGGFALKF